ncbi:MAG TPA: hypothetical protein VGM23_14945 [Armatimonadota bacterium]|jgi:hypothetical protein
MMGFNVIIGLGILAVIGLIVRELLAFFRKRGAYSLRRLTLRMSTAVMLLFLLVSVFIGIRLFHLDTPEAFPRHWIAFWGCVSLLTGAIFCMALADFRLLDEESRVEAGKLWQEIAETIASYESHPKDE